MTGNIVSFLPSRIINILRFFKPNKPKEQLSFWEVKILGWFAITGYTLQNALQDHTYTLLASFLTRRSTIGPYVLCYSDSPITL